MQPTHGVEGERPFKGMGEEEKGFAAWGNILHTFNK
jgi:hypothetical protein